MIDGWSIVVNYLIWLELCTWVFILRNFPYEDMTFTLDRTSLLGTLLGIGAIMLTAVCVSVLVFVFAIQQILIWLSRRPQKATG